MIKFIILVFTLFLFGCTSKNQLTTNTICPKVLFSEDNQVYITTEESKIELNNISYKAEINNYNFTNCYFSNEKTIFRISILFVVEPKSAKKLLVKLPYFITLLDEYNNVVDKQYYVVEGEFKQNLEKTSFVETEIIDIQNINISKAENNKYKVVLGFMLDKEKLHLLN